MVMIISVFFLICAVDDCIVLRILLYLLWRCLYLFKYSFLFVVKIFICLIISSYLWMWCVYLSQYSFLFMVVMFVFVSELFPICGGNVCICLSILSYLWWWWPVTVECAAATVASGSASLQYKFNPLTNIIYEFVTTYRTQLTTNHEMQCSFELHCRTFAVTTGQSSECGALSDSRSAFSTTFEHRWFVKYQNNCNRWTRASRINSAISDFAAADPTWTDRTKKQGGNEVTCCSSRICPQISLKSLTTLTPLSWRRNTPKTLTVGILPKLLITVYI